jgi:hypothetical protein
MQRLHKFQIRSLQLLHQLVHQLIAALALMQRKEKLVQQLQ